MRARKWKPALQNDHWLGQCRSHGSGNGSRIRRDNDADQRPDNLSVQSALFFVKFFQVP
ncbi:protein of unknown function [Cupriavidus taiwanensis]|nr:protein of unknown function [Cupriavidus taiwanensis]